MEQREEVRIPIGVESRALVAQIEREIKTGNYTPDRDTPYRVEREGNKVCVMAYDRRELAVYRVGKRQLHFVR